MYGPPHTAAEQLRIFMYACGSALAMATGTDETPLLAPIPRQPSPAAHRAAVDHQLADLIPRLDRMLSGKVGRPPVGTPLATLGRLAVSEGEKLDIANNSYRAGPKFWALIAALKADAVNTTGGHQ